MLLQLKPMLNASNLNWKLIHLISTIDRSDACWLTIDRWEDETLKAMIVISHGGRSTATPIHRHFQQISLLETLRVLLQLFISENEVLYAIYTLIKACHGLY